MNSSKLLIEEHPLQILPQLAKSIGLNEAIILQQVHYWLRGKSAKRKDGKDWIYNTYEDWQEQFPFWSVSTIRRTISNLEKKKLLHVGNYNRLPIDKTKWYSINYDELNRVNSPCVQNEQSMCSEWTDISAQNEQTITRDYPETTTESKDMSGKPDERIPFKEIIDYLNEKTGKSFKNVEGNKKVIRARWNEGNRLEDFKKVIDVKSSQWLSNKEMQVYLRPSTLFSSKFENYLNEGTVKVKSSRSVSVLDKIKQME